MSCYISCFCITVAVFIRFTVWFIKSLPNVWCLHPVLITFENDLVLYGFVSRKLLFEESNVKKLFFLSQWGALRTFFHLLVFVWNLKLRDVNVVQVFFHHVVFLDHRCRISVLYLQFNIFGCSWFNFLWLNMKCKWLY